MDGARHPSTPEVDCSVLMVKILFQLNQLGYGGTEKAILTFISNLDRKLFEPSVFFNTTANTLEHHRVRFLSYISKRYKKKFDEKYVHGLARLEDFSNAVGGRLYCGNGFTELLQTQSRLGADILHFTRGLPDDFYTKEVGLLSRQSRLVEYNIFGTKPRLSYLKHLDHMLFVSEWCISRSEWAVKGKSSVLYFPVPEFKGLAKVGEGLRRRLGIDSESIVLGRLSRPNLDDGSFVLSVLLEVFKLYPNAHFVCLGASSAFVAATKGFGNIHCLPATIDEGEIESFLRSLDILLHYRIEGETFGLNIAEAMSRGIPVVTHRSALDNAQVELLTRFRPSGLISAGPSVSDYTEAVMRLVSDKDLRRTLGSNGQVTAAENFATGKLTRRLESIYLGLS